MRKSKLLFIVFSLITAMSIVAISAFAAPDDLTVKFSEDFESVNLNTGATASDGTNPKIGGVTFQQGGRTGKVEVLGNDENKYALITQTDKVGTSSPYAYVKLGSNGSAVKDGTTVTGVKKSSNDISNFKYMVFEIDVMSPTGKLIAGSIDIQGRDVNASGSTGYWNTNATAGILKFGNSNGATYIYADFDSAMKRYINPFEFTNIQIIVENITDGESTNIEIQSHVYVNGEFWFTKVASNVPTSYAGGQPNAVFTEARVNYTTSTDSTYTLAIDNLAWKTVPAGSSTDISELVKVNESKTEAFEYVRGGQTAIGYNDTGLANVIALADADTAVKLLSDCLYEGQSISVTKNITLDLNGKTLDYTIERERRDAGIFVVSANKSFTLKSSAIGGKIFSAANGTAADPIITTNSNSAVNVYGADENGNSTLSVFGADLVRAWSADVTVNIDGGEYYRLRTSDYAIVQLQANFTLSVKNALFYDIAEDSADGIFCLNGRYAIGTSVTSNANIDNCVLYSVNNITTHAYSMANIVFTDCYIAGDIKPTVFSNTDQGAQTAGYVTLGDGCMINGELSENVIFAEGLELQNIANALEVTVKYNTFTQTEGAFDESSFVINSYDLVFEFDRFVSVPGKTVTVVWKDADGGVIATTEGVKGEEITAVPYGQFFENGAVYEYLKDWVNGVPDEWNESLTIPEDYSGAEYILTVKEGGKLCPYDATFPLLFNVAADTNFKVSFYVPEAPSQIEYVSAYVGDTLIYGIAEDGSFTDWSKTVLIDGKNHFAMSDLIGVVSGATEEILATLVFKCDGRTVTHRVSSDIAYYCNAVLDGDSYSEYGKKVVVNIANYLVSCADVASSEYTEITNALKTVIDNNSSRIVTPDESELVIPNTAEIRDYISGVSIAINKNGPYFLFYLTEEGKGADVSISSGICNGESESYDTVGYVKTGNANISDINRITVRVTPAQEDTVSLTYSLANYCKALEGREGVEVAYALYGYAKSQMAYKNILDITVEKSSSHRPSVTASPNEKITYYITVTNNEKQPLTLNVTDEVPENTVYVSGAEIVDGDSLGWTPTVPVGESLTLSYTVRVKNDKALCEGGVVESTKAKVGKISAETNPVYVELTFNSYDAKFIDYAVDALADSTFEGVTLAKWIYYVAYSQYSSLGYDTSEEVIDAIVNKSASADLLDKIAPGLYGGALISEAIDGAKGSMTARVNAADLVAGDVIISKTDNSVNTFIYTNEGLYAIDRGCIRVDTDAVLSSLTKRDAYAVFRISAALVNLTHTDPDRTPDVLNEKQEAIVNTAKYYLQRGQWLQYDDTYFCMGQTSLGNESRWEAGLKSPEEFTSQNIGHINCAAFTHDVYWTTFGHKLPNSMYTTANLTANSAANNMKMFSFTRTADQVHTEEEKEQVKNDFLNALEPGDIMVILRGSSGHAMLYIGDGLFIHSTGSSYNYGGSYGVETYEPTIRYHRVNDYFFNEASTNGYIFGKVTSLCIVRPLNNATWAGYEVSENSQNRIDNLMGITGEKLPSVAPGVTVNPGDNITYTFSFRNDNFADVTLEITDKVAENTAYISGAERVEGDNLYWTVTVPAHSTLEVSYTVKVFESAAYGTVIESNAATIGGVLFKTYTTAVRRTLTADEQQALITAFDELKSEGTELVNIELVNELYKRALGIDFGVFADTDITEIAEGADGFFTAEGMPLLSSKQAYTPNSGSKYNNMIAPTLFGGRRLSTPTNQDIRTHLAYSEDLVVGDILFGRTSSSRFVYIYLGGDNFISLSTLNALSVSVADQLERLPAYAYHYAILRPSFATE